MFTLRYQGNDTVVPEWSSHHAATARDKARIVATAAQRPVEVLRGGKPAYVMMPDGNVTPPGGVVVAPRSVCTKDSGRPCFCTPCREDRKAAR